MNIIIYTGIAWALKTYIVIFKVPTHGDSISIKEDLDEKIMRTTSLFDEEDQIIKSLSYGYKALLSNQTADRIKNDPGVQMVEEDTAVKIASFQIKNVEEYPESRLYSLAENFILQKNAPWGISRISGHDHDYEYVETSGQNVNVYVIDTGVDVNHFEFKGRASWGFNAVENSKDTDEHGHGTHCAGVIAGTTFGIAKKANIIAVKVLDSNGEGMVSNIIEGIDFVMKDHQKRMEEYKISSENFHSENNNFKTAMKFFDFPYLNNLLDLRNLISKLRTRLGYNRVKPKAIVNMSVGGGKSNALNFAIKLASKNLGIHFSTAAGNEHQDACRFSPASSGSSMTIGASDRDNRIASFSNTGACVDVYAPGTDIISAWPGNGTKMASGTSMATPHVSGIMAVYASLADFKSEELIHRIIKDSELIVQEPITGYKSTFLLFSIPKYTTNKPFASLKKLFDRLKSD